MAAPKTFVARWEDDAFQQILDAIDQDHMSRYILSLPNGYPPTPNVGELRQLVEVGIEASLEREEGRDVLVSLMYLPQSVAEYAIPFANSVTLDASAIRRLAPAVAPGSGLGVSRDVANGDSQCIWGMCERREDALEVRTVAAGRVVVQFGRANIALFSGPYCRVFRTAIQDVLDIIVDLVPTHGDTAFVLLAYLLELANSVRALGHGGSLVVLPTRNAASHAYTPRHRLQPPFAGLADRCKASFARYRDLLAPMEEDPLYLLTLLPDIAQLFHDDTPDPKVTEVLNTVAHFTAIDGATVLDSTLTVLATGAVLETGNAIQGELTWDEWQPGRKKWRTVAGGELATLGGMRHQSAFRFVFGNPDTLVLVCSQDGTVTLMARPDGHPHPRVAVHVEHALLR